MKAQLGSDAFSAQYQQMPVPPGGAMIKRDWIKRYQELPPQRERSLILQSWDTASKGGPENDFSVCTTWCISRDRRWYLIDVWRKRVDYPELKAAVRSLASQHAANRVLVEDAGAGTALVQELLGEVDGILAVKPDRDKTTRMSVVSAKFESGLVFLPERAPWLADFEAELFAFPGSRHDDQCDSVSQALSDDNFGLPMEISAEALAASRIWRPWMRRYVGPYGGELAIVCRRLRSDANFKDNRRQTDLAARQTKEGTGFAFGPTMEMVVIDRANSISLMARFYRAACAERAAVAVTSRSDWPRLRPHALGETTSSRDWSFPTFRSMTFGLRRESPQARSRSYSGGCRLDRRPRLLRSSPCGSRQRDHPWRSQLRSRQAIGP